MPPIDQGPSAAESLEALVSDTNRHAIDSVPALPFLVAVAALTGDPALATDDLRPVTPDALDPEGGATPEQVGAARARALAALDRHLERGCPTVPPPSPEQRSALIGFLIGTDNLEAFDELLVEEMGGPSDERRPTWSVGAIDPDRTFTVGIIGAGMSGLLAAHRFRQAGMEVTIFEKRSDVGGTWFDNTYPGCRVDVPSALYSYSFEDQEWDDHFSTQPQLLSYFRAMRDRFGVEADVRYETEVVAARFQDQDQRWNLDVIAADGGRTTVTVDAVVSAVGQLNRPSIPAIPGRISFRGPAFHSARWDPEISLAGRRVAVIGTGASAMQLVPAIAAEPAELFVLQRSPSWMLPTPDYRQPVGEAHRLVARSVPTFGAWNRLWLFWSTHEGLLPAAEIDPTWTEPGSVSERNARLRRGFTKYLDQCFGDRPDLLDHVVPAYPPLAKRAIRDDGSWSEALKKPHVELITGTVAEISPDGLVLEDGRRLDVDVIIYGTGFEASRFLVPMSVTGRAGLDLHEVWDGDARAHLGIMVPGFPNFFCLYGPNTNIVINGSVVFFSECEVRYVVDCIRHLVATGSRTAEVREDVHRRYNDWVDRGNGARAWGAPDVENWYKSTSGRVSQNWPFSLLEYWRLTRAVDPDDLV